MKHDTTTPFARLTVERDSRGVLFRGVSSSLAGRRQYFSGASSKLVAFERCGQLSQS